MQFSFVRRIDDLGRIVIPKEIRNKLNFNYGDLLDLNINLDALIIKKTNSNFNKEYINEIINLLEYLNNFDIIICDTEKVIAKSETNLVNVNDCISSNLRNIILEHKSETFINGVKITDNCFLDGEVFIKSLIKESNTIGLLILKSKNNINKDINSFINIIAKLLLR